MSEPEHEDQQFMDAVFTDDDSQFLAKGWKRGEVPDSSIIERYPEHARLIGSIVAHWSTLEASLVTLLAMSMKADRETAWSMVYAIRSSSSRVAAMESALNQILKDDQAMLDEIGEIFREANKVLEKRNKYAHALYADNGTENPAIVPMRDFFAGKTPSYSVRLKDLEDVFGNMKTINGRLMRLIARRSFGLRPDVPSK